MKLTVLVVVFFAFVLAFVECCSYDDKECPDYTVIEKRLKYEVRSYPALTWVITEEYSRLEDVAERVAVNRLREYFEGKNNRSMKIPMTVPMRTRISKINKYNYEIAFLLPASVAKNPPTPTDLRVGVYHEGPSMYVVRSFSGFLLRDETWDKEIEELIKFLAKDDTIVKSFYYLAQYQTHSQYFENYNEIWMLKEIVKK